MCTYTHTHVRVNVYLHTHTHTCTCVRTHTHTHTLVYVYVHSHTCVYMCTYTCTRACICVRTNTHTRACKCVRTHTHAHIYTSPTQRAVKLYNVIWLWLSPNRHKINKTTNGRGTPYTQKCNFPYLDLPRRPPNPPLSLGGGFLPLDLAHSTLILLPHTLRSSISLIASSASLRRSRIVTGGVGNGNIYKPAILGNNQKL